METQYSVTSALDSGETTRANHKPGGSRIYKLVGICFGLLCVIQSLLNVYMWLQVDENSNKSKNSSTCNFTSVSADDIRGVLLERDQLLREKEQLNQFIDQLLQTKDKLLEENSQLNEKNSQLNRENSQLNEKNSQLNEKNSQLNQENSQLNEKNSQLNRENSQLNEKNSQLNQENSQLNEKNSQLNQENSQLNEKNSQLNQENSQLNEKNSQLNQENSQLNEKNSQLNQENSQLNEKNSQLNRDKNQLLQEKDKLLEENSQVNQENSQLNRDKNQLIQEKAKLLEENSRLNQALPNLPRCSPGWKRFRSSCYHLSSFKSTWGDAKKNCERLEAHLVIISDDAEKDFVSSYGQAVNLWIGFKYEWNYMSSMWTSKWVDGSQLCYNNFGKTFSSSTPWTCAYQRATWYIWDTAECNEYYYWMCEKELNF